MTDLIADVAVPLMPVIVLVVFAIINLILDFVPTLRRFQWIVSLIGALLSFIVVLMFYNDAPIYLGGTGTAENSLLRVDAFSRFFAVVFLLVAMSVILSSSDFTANKENPGVFYALLLFSTTGMILVAQANDLLTLLVSWELGSIPAYAMTAFDRHNKQNNEAAVKFFLNGAFSSALIAFGISMIYGLKQTTNLEVIARSLPQDIVDPLYFLALGILVSGVGFKLAVFPLNFWVPDTYQGAPTIVTTFLAAASKKMGFVAAFRVLVIAFSASTLIADYWGTVFYLLAVLTMTAGNLIALWQNNVKRMLAYSSIAHAGYIMIAFAVIGTKPSLTVFALTAAMLHVLSHAIMKIAAFLAVYSAEKELRSTEFSAFTGLGKRQPFTAFVLLISLLSMMGIPPLIGFFTKFMLFIAALDADLIPLAVIFAINSAISVYYYARLIKVMYIDMPPEVEHLPRTKLIDFQRVPVPLFIVLALMLIGIFLGGIGFTIFIDFAEAGAQSLSALL